MINKKLLSDSIILFFFSISVLPSTSCSFNDDINITISAGVLRNTWGNIGLG